jgi:hypothetical protein
VCTDSASGCEKPTVFLELSGSSPDAVLFSKSEPRPQGSGGKSFPPLPCGRGSLRTFRAVYCSA